MKRKHSTKRALIASILSLCLCFSMLIGTTFAWFTDSVTSSGNIIQSGTLKIGMYWSDGTEAVPADESTDWTDASTGPIFKYDKWEPGYTEARHIKIANEGTLALKYAIRIIPDGEVSELADVIDVYYADPAKQIANRGELTTDMKLGTLTQVLNNMDSTATGNLAAEASDTITLVLKMQESAGNEYQGKSIGSSFSIQLVATQDTVEEDSFDNLFDKNAPSYGSASVPVPAPGVSAAEIHIFDDNNNKIGSIIVPAGAIADGATEILVDISATDYTPNISVAAGSETETFDLSVSNLKENNDVPVKVALFIGKNLDPNTVQVYHYDSIISGSIYNADSGYVTFETTSFSPYTLVYDKDSTYIPPVADSNVPTAGVSVKNEYVGVSLPWGSYGQWSPNAEVDADPKLEAAYLFTCTQTLEEAKESGYADWECDFFVKLDRDLGENQIFLGGNYGSFGWVGFHNGDVTLDANTEIPLLGSVTSNPWTYGDVIEFVGEFTCGVGDVNDALSGATFTVMLRLTNPENKAEYYNVATIEYTFPKCEVSVSTVDELKTALENGDNIVLTENIAITNTLMTTKDVVIDLNGNTMTTPSSGAVFQSQSNASPDITITSSVPGAAINVSGGDTSVLLGYGSTVIENVTINVTGCDNYSPNPFNVYGDLTLGEGTVVNIDYLGTALISNNGAVNIVIDGAEINIGTFKTNGTAIITLNQASTLKIKNTEITIDEFVLSSFGGDSLVSKIDGVTIENCTFDVTDSNEASCTFVAKDGKYRLVQN